MKSRWGRQQLKVVQLRENNEQTVVILNETDVNLEATTGGAQTALLFDLHDVLQQAGKISDYTSIGIRVAHVSQSEELREVLKGAYVPEGYGDAKLDQLVVILGILGPTDFNKGGWWKSFSGVTGLSFRLPAASKPSPDNI